MTFWQALKETYRGSIAFLIACPLLALVPVAFEFVQHIAEVYIGMYDSLGSAEAVEHHPLRMGFGLLKVAALTVPGYWIVRYLSSRSPAFARRLDPRAVRLFSLFFLFNVGLAALQMFFVTQSGAVLLAGFVIGEIVAALLAAWGVAAALGNPAIGPLQSIAIMGRQLAWTFALLIAAMMPLMIPHYLLAAFALLGPKVLLWPILAIDSLLVGWLTAVLVASAYVAAMRASGRADVTLTPAT